MLKVQKIQKSSTSTAKKSVKAKKIVGQKVKKSGRVEIKLSAPNEKTFEIYGSLDDPNSKMSKS